MAESALDRLKRLAAEKKAKATQPVQASAEGGATQAVETKQLSKEELVELVTPNTEANLEARLQQVKEELANEHQESSDENRSNAENSGPATGSSDSETGSHRSNVPAKVLDSGSASPVTASQSRIGTSDHPLALQFAELEQALLDKTPEFKTLLRNIHRHLGQEPELVTQMTEEEIQMVVSGLVVFANAEIVAPAIAKSAKAKIAAAKKQPISADDL